MKGYPRRYVIYDTETTSHPALGEPGRKILEFRLGCAVVHDPEFIQGAIDRDFTFYSVDDFHDLIGEMRRTDDPIYIFAHNHSFDARVVGFFRHLALGTYSLVPPAGVLARRGSREPLFVIGGKPFLMRVFRPDGQVLFLYDVGNWLDLPLARIGELIGYPKWPMPHETDTDHHWLLYCRNDVEVTRFALEHIWTWCRDRGIKDWQPTIAAQALQSYRLRYARRKIEQPVAPEHAALCKAAFYGGRIDCFRLGRIESPVVEVDVNSMYPSLMKDGLFPCKIVEVMHEETKPTPGTPPHPIQTTAEVWIDSDSAAYPVHAQDGTFYVCGRVRTVLCGPELRRAVERGDVVSYGRYTRYRLSRLFTDFVSDLWAVRRDYRARGIAIGDKLCKVFMDSLFGKFGQRSGEWITVGQDYPQDHYGQGVVVGVTDLDTVDWRVIAGIYQRRIRDELAPHAFVAIPAFVTAYGRVFMDAVREKLYPDGIYYQATDSLLIDGGNLDMLQASGLYDPDGLGKFRVEDSWPWVDIRNQGWIERPGGSIRPGVPGQEPLPVSGVIDWERWEGPWMGILHRRVSCASTQTISTRLHGTYSKQKKCHTGRLQPWVISNWHLTPEQQRKTPLSRDWDRR